MPDEWVYDELQGNLIRINSRKRSGLFTPNGVKGCPVVVTRLSPHRTTIVEFEDGTKQTLDHDDWRRNGSAHIPLRAKWTGYTVFKVLEKPYARSQASARSTEAQPQGATTSSETP